MFGDTQLFTQDAEDTSKYVEWTPPGLKDLIPEDIREHEALADIKDIGGLAKGYVEAKSAIPKVPEKPEDYKFEPGENQAIDAERLGKWKSNFHGLGLTQKQFESVVTAALAEETEIKAKFDEGIAKSRAEAETALKTEWGAQYEKNMESAKMFYQTVTEKMGEPGKAVIEFIENSKFGDNPEIIKFMAFCAKAIGEDSLELGAPKPTNTGVKYTDSGFPMIDEYPEMNRHNKR